MHHFDLLKVLAIGLCLALAFGLITHRLKLSPIVGYLLAGFLIGPKSPGYVADLDLTNQLAEVGVILLMFGVGLHFNLKDLMSVKWIAIPGAVAQSFVATILGVLIAHTAGMALSTGLILGLGLAVASTVVLIRVLMDNNSLDTIHGHVAVGWLIVEDIFTVLVLVLLPAIALLFNASGDSGANIPLSLAWAVLKLVLLGILIIPIGGRLVPRLLAFVARTRSRELFILSILVLAFVIATGSALVFGASVALGAFLAGMVVGKSNVSHQAASDLLPMRDAFAVIFFLSVGMLFDPVILMKQPLLVISCLLVILLAKPLIAFIVVVILGYTTRTALTVAFGLAQIGEFSFILAQQAMTLDLLPMEGYSLLVACALISITLNPAYFKLMYPLEKLLRSNNKVWCFLNRRVECRCSSLNANTHEVLSKDDIPTAIVVGYGPVGQRVIKLLQQFGIRPVVLDLNIDTIQNLTEQGYYAVFGDSTKHDVLLSAGIEQTKYLVITLPDINNTIDTIMAARILNPDIEIMVRTRYINSKSNLEALGVTSIAFEEIEVARSLAKLLQATIKK